jgi:type IV secretory pathway protease TraF
MTRLVLALAVVASATIYAQSPAFTRGERVQVKSLDTARRPATTMPLVVVALPGDQLSISGNRLVLNGAPVTQFSADFLARVIASPERIPARLPEGHYFVMGEQRNSRDISEYWGQHSAVSLQPAQ